MTVPSVLARLSAWTRLATLAPPGSATYHQLRRLLETLSDEGLVERAPSRRHTQWRVRDRRLTQAALRVEASRTAHIWSSLTMSSWQRLHVLDRTGSVMLAAEICGLAASTLERQARGWWRAGLLLRTANEWSIAPAHQATRALLEIMSEAAALDSLDTAPAASILLHHAGCERVIATPPRGDRTTDLTEGWTALSLPDLALGLPGVHLGWRGPRVLKALDASLIVSLLHPGDPRVRTAVALSIAAEDPARVRALARHYGLQTEAESWLAFLGGRTSDGFVDDATAAQLLAQMGGYRP